MVAPPAPPKTETDETERSNGTKPSQNGHEVALSPGDLTTFGDEVAEADITGQASSNGEAEAEALTLLTEDDKQELTPEEIEFQQLEEAIADVEADLQPIEEALRKGKLINASSRGVLNRIDRRMDQIQELIPKLAVAGVTIAIGQPLFMLIGTALVLKKVNDILQDPKAIARRQGERTYKSAKEHIEKRLEEAPDHFEELSKAIFAEMQQDKYRGEGKSIDTYIRKLKSEAQKYVSDIHKVAQQESAKQAGIT